jgi:hypothetical protein
MNNHNKPFCWPAKPAVLLVLLGALSVSLGWGIRGTFGGGLGAMVPGAFAGLCVAYAAGRARDEMEVLRLAAVGAMAMSFGGSMTYGQTLGLTQNPNVRELHYWWGILGVAVKGGVWIGIVGALLGIWLNRERYRTVEVGALILVMVVVGMVGVQLLNRPMDPPEALPRVYFSNFHHPLDPNDPPRTECWGGLWMGLLALLIYTRLVKKDTAAFGLGLFGIAGGALGFSIGQMFQAAGSKYTPFGATLQPWIDWWKVMEMSFGFIAGAFLVAGALWSCRAGVRTSEVAARSKPNIRLEWISVVAWICLLGSYGLGIHVLRRFVGSSFGVGVIPLAGLVAGRVWPWLMGIVLVSMASASEGGGLPLAAIVAVAATVLSLVWRRSIDHVESGELARPRLRLLYLLVVSQTAFSLVKHFVWAWNHYPDHRLGEMLLGPRAGAAVQASFCVLMVLILVLARTIRSMQPSANRIQ